jgi:hypothetical protein
MTFHHENPREIKEWQYLAIVVFTAAVLILPVIFFGIPSGNDLPQHFQFANAYYDSIINGDGFPNFSSSENFGYGSVGIRFYPPLSYYVLAIFRIVAGNWFDAAWLAFMFWMVLGSLGIYFWARWWMQPKYSAVAAAAYALSPYHLNQLFISFIYADFAGAAVLAFCFGFLTRVCDRGKRTDVLGFAISYAALVLTHLPTTIIGSMCLALYALVLIRKQYAQLQIARSAGGIILGLAASSFYWIRMVGEMGWLNHATEKYSSGHYYYGNRFFPSIIFHLATDYTDNLVLSDVIMTLSLSCFVAGLAYLAYKKQNGSYKGPEARIFRYIFPLAGFAFLMTTPLSFPIWAALEPLQKVQFPARWMSVVAMCGAIIVGASAYFIMKGGFLKKRAWLYGGLALVSLFLLIDFVYMLYPSAFVPIPRDKFEAQMLDLPEQENRTFWWSIWSQPDALKIKEKIVAGNRQSTITNWESEERDFTTTAGEPGFARVATFWYPRWRAEVNGFPVEVTHDENGAIMIPIPAQEATVRLWFQEPAAITIAGVFSLVTWLLLGLTFAFSFAIRLRHRRHNATAQEAYAI